MDKKLFIQAVTKFALGAVLVGLLIFLPAGTLNFGGGWLLMALLFIPMFCAGLVMLKKSPTLLKSRLDAKEKQGAQQLVVKLSALMFLAGFILAGLDFRFGWSHIPAWLRTASVVLFLISYLLYAEVLRENAYLSRTIQVQEGQKVVSTGLYGIVRHPMYAATLILFLSMPLILGSWPALVVFCCYPLIIVKRLLNEEQVLRSELSGYEEYTQKVKYRLLPYIW